MKLLQHLSLRVRRVHAPGGQTSDRCHHSPRHRAEQSVPEPESYLGIEVRKRVENHEPRDTIRMYEREAERQCTAERFAEQRDRTAIWNDPLNRGQAIS